MSINSTSSAADSFTLIFDPETGLLRINVLNAGERLQLRQDWPDGPSRGPVIEIRNPGGDTETRLVDLSTISAIEISLNDEIGARSGYAHYMSDILTVDMRLTVPVTLITPDHSRHPVIASGASGADDLQGGGASDSIWGHAGDDLINGGGGYDRLFGGSGDDTLNGGSGQDRLYGGSGDNVLNGGRGRDRLFGGSGEDTLDGGNGRDKLVGRNGDDALNGGRGNDIIKGGGGFDTATFAGSIRDYTIQQTGQYNWRVSGLDGNDRLIRVEALAFEDYTFFTDGRNNTPILQAHAETTNEDTSLRLENLLNGAFDPDGDAMSISEVTPSGNGSVVSIGLDGAVTYDPNGAFDYLADGETATDTFTYTVADGRGGTQTETVTLTITGVNDGPQIVSTSADASGSVTEAGNAVSGTAGATGTLAAIGLEAGFTATWTGSAAGIYGTFTIGTGGAWTYALDDASTATNALAQGVTVSEAFSATVTDQFGETAIQDVTVTITGSNDAPVLSTPAAALAGSVTEIGVDDAGSAQASGQIIAIDPDTGHVLSWGTSGALSYGTVNVSSTGLWTYTLDNDLAATQALAANVTMTETFNVTVRDEHGALDSQQISVTVNGSNDAPRVAAALTVTADAATADQVVNLLEGASDLDMGETATLQVANVSGLVPGLTLNGNSLTLDPEHPDFMALPLGEEREITVSFDVVDAQGARVAQELSITVTGVYSNTAPTTVNDVYMLTENETATFTADLGVLANDSDVDASDTLQVTAFNGVTISGATQVTLTSGTIVTIDETGAMTIDSSNAFNSLGVGDQGQEVVNYTISDGEETSTGQMTLLVSGANDVPVALDDTFNITNGVASFSGNIFNNNGFGADFDPEGGYFALIGANGSNLDSFVTFTLASGADLSLWSSGNFIYYPVGHPSTDIGEIYVDSFTYTIEDEFYESSTATVQFNVTDALLNASVAINLSALIIGTRGAEGSLGAEGGAEPTQGGGNRGGFGGLGGTGGVGLALFDGETLEGDNNADSLTISAVAFGGVGGHGGRGGTGGDGIAGTLGIDSGLSNIQFFGDDGNGVPTSATATNLFYFEAGDGGDGGNGGGGGQGGAGVAQVINNVITANAGDDIISFSASATGHSGGRSGFGGEGGSGYYGGYTTRYETRDIYFEEYDTIISTYVTVGSSYRATDDGVVGSEWRDGTSGSGEATVTGNSGFGGDGNDHLTLFASAQSFDPGDRFTLVLGTARVVNATIADNTLSGGDGNDTLELIAVTNTYGSDWDVTQAVTVTGNTLDGGAGDDRFIINLDTESVGPSTTIFSGNTFDGGTGRDTLDLSGFADDGFYIDLMTGDWGFDGFTAGSGANTISDIEDVIGGQARDILIGSDAANTFVGGAGNDSLTGHGGSDEFVFGAGDNHDRITDFSTDALEGDVVRVLNSGYATAQEFLDSGFDTFYGVQFYLGASDSLTLEGVFLADLSLDDFLLV